MKRLYIGGKEDPYLVRWYIIPRNPLFNIYLHKIIRDDDDRALHDHPWWSLSLRLRGDLIEVDGNGQHFVGRVRLRSATYAHRLCIPKFQKGASWTLFFTGPRLREWGFHCPSGWQHWSEFTDVTGAKIGKGCGE